MERGPFWIRLWIMIIKDRCIALQHKCLLWFFTSLLIVPDSIFNQYNVSIGLFGWYLRIFSYLSFCVKFSMYILSGFVYESRWPEHYCEAIFMCEVFLVRIRLRIMMTRSPTRQRFSWATIPLTRTLTRSVFHGWGPWLFTSHHNTQLLNALITDKRWYLCNKISLVTSF